MAIKEDTELSSSCRHTESKTTHRTIISLKKEKRKLKSDWVISTYQASKNHIEVCKWGWDTFSS